MHVPLVVFPVPCLWVGRGPTGAICRCRRLCWPLRVGHVRNHSQAPGCRWPRVGHLDVSCGVPPPCVRPVSSVQCRSRCVLRVSAHCSASCWGCTRPICLSPLFRGSWEEARGSSFVSTCCVTRCKHVVWCCGWAGDCSLQACEVARGSLHVGM